MGWTEPKTNWMAGDGIKASDLNRIEGNLDYMNRILELEGRLLLSPTSPNAAVEMVCRTITLDTTKKIVLLESQVYIPGGGARLEANFAGSVLASYDLPYGSNNIFSLDNAPTVIEVDSIFRRFSLGIFVWNGAYAQTARVYLKLFYKDIDVQCPPAP